MRARSFAVVVVIVSTSLMPSIAEATTVASFVPDTERDVPRWLERYAIPDADVAYVDGGEIAWTKRFGTSRGDVFAVASLSKTATAVAIMTLVEDGKLDLDRPVNDYLDRWQISSSRYDAKGVSTRRLLNHTSGMPVGVPTERLSESPDIVAVLKGMASVPAAELVKEPGTTFTYSNPGYGVLELLIEEVSGDPYTTAMRDRVFEPLAMRDTGFEDDDALVDRFVPGFHKADDPVERFVAFPRAAGGMLSTAADVARLLEALSRTKDEGGLLAASSLDEMRRLDRLSRGAFGLRDGGYALGLARLPLPSGRLVVANNGGWWGCRTMMLAVPEAGRGFVVLTNSETGSGVALELTLAFFEDLGERPRIAAIFSTGRTGLRIGTAAALALCGLLLLRAALAVRRGERRWPGRVRVRRLALRTVPLAVLGVGLIAYFDTELIARLGLAPARFVSEEYFWLVGALGTSLIAIGAIATLVPKRRPDEERRSEPEPIGSRST